MTDLPPSWLHVPSPDASPAIIAEVAQAHDGSLGMAHAFIDAIAAQGAHAVKFQTHIAAAESTRAEPWRVKFSQQDATRYDYWKRMEFTEEQWLGLKRHASEKGLLFLSSPFSMTAMDLLERIGVAAWKVASGEVTNCAMIARMAATGRPVILSSGMSGYAEIDKAVAALGAKTPSFAVLQCTTRYPCLPEAIGLNVLDELRRRYPAAAVGLSDHSAMIYPGLAAVTLGAKLIEVHLALSRDMFGPDMAASLTPEELGQLVAGAHVIDTMRRSPVSKEAAAEAASPLRAVFMKSVVAARDLPHHHILTTRDLDAKKPGSGIPAQAINALVGRRLARPVEADALLGWDDLERLP